MADIGKKISVISFTAIICYYAGVTARALYDKYNFALYEAAVACHEANYAREKASNARQEANDARREAEEAHEMAKVFREMYLKACNDNLYLRQALRQASERAASESSPPPYDNTN